MSEYTLFGSLFIMLIFPIIVSNYWLYFGIGLFPISMFAMGLIKTPFHTLSWLLIFGLVFLFIYKRDYSLFGIIFPFLALITIPRNAKMMYRSTLRKSSEGDELCFKYLYKIGIIVLHNRKSNQLISVGK